MADTSITPTVGSLTATGNAPARVVSTVLTPSAGAVALTGAAARLQTVVAPLNARTPMRLLLRRFRRSHAVPIPPVTPFVPADLLHLLTVRVLLNAPLLHTLTVVTGALNAPLLHTLTVREPLLGLTHILRVIPPVVILGSDDVQKPTQQVTKTP